MPEPISGPVAQSVYEPSSGGECDPSVASCGPEPAPRVLTLEPIVIDGSAGKNALVAAYDRGSHQPPRCESEKNAALLTCGAAIASGVSMALSAPTGFGLLVAAASGGIALARCGQTVDDYQSCLDEGAARAAAANLCEERGGLPVRGIEDAEVICLRADP